MIMNENQLLIFWTIWIAVYFLICIKWNKQQGGGENAYIWIVTLVLCPIILIYWIIKQVIIEDWN